MGGGGFMRTYAVPDDIRKFKPKGTMVKINLLPCNGETPQKKLRPFSNHEDGLLIVVKVNHQFHWWNSKT